MLRTHRHEDKQLTTKQKVVVLKQAALGMVYLHSRKPPLIHKDMKGLNILLHGSGDAKVTDFGISDANKEARVGRGGFVGTACTMHYTACTILIHYHAGTIQHALRTIQHALCTVLIHYHAGTVPYMAPEMLVADSTFGLKVDSYGFACVIFETLAVKIPWQGIQCASYY
jgi:serine/threonine protein kinase